MQNRYEICEAILLFLILLIFHIIFIFQFQIEKFFVTNCTNYYNYIVLFKKLEIRILLYDFYSSINEKIYQYCKMYLFLLNNFYLKYFVSFIFFKI